MHGKVLYVFRHFTLLVRSHEISKENEYRAFYPGYIKSLVCTQLNGESLIIFKEEFINCLNGPLCLRVVESMFV